GDATGERDLRKKLPKTSGRVVPRDLQRFAGTDRGRARPRARARYHPRPVFETLSERLGSAFAALRGKRELTAENVEEGLQAVRTALLEADVHFQVARDLVERVRVSVLGAKAV